MSFNVQRFKSLCILDVYATEAHEFMPHFEIIHFQLTDFDNIDKYGSRRAKK